MLPKENRLKKRKDFESVFRKGKGFKEDFLVLKKNKNNLNQSRFGFLVGGRVSKKATIRNKIRRRLSSLVQKKLAKIKPGIDVIFIVQPGLENKNFAQIERTIDRLFQTAKVIKC